MTDLGFEVSARPGGVLPSWPARDRDLVDAADHVARPYPEVSE